MKKTNNKGFSLIELIIVIAIMAILIAIIAPNLTKYLGKSKDKTDVKNLDEIESTLKTCLTDYDMENDSLLSDDSNKVACLAWNSSGAVMSTTATAPITIPTGKAAVAQNTDFEDIVNSSIEASKAKSKKTSKYAVALIEYTTQSQYKITVDWAD